MRSQIISILNFGNFSKNDNRKIIHFKRTSAERQLKEIDGWKEYIDLSEDIKKDYETIDHFIKEVARDTTSQAFRYPDNFKKQKPFPVDDKEQQFLNVTNLSCVVDWLSYRLDGISMAIAVQLTFYGDNY